MKLLSFPHIASYVVAALSTLAFMNPAVAAAIPVVGPYLAAAIPLAGALLTFAHQVANKPASVSSSTVVKIATIFFLAPLVYGMMILSACTTTGGLTPTGQTLVTVSVDLAVGTAESQGVPAAQINSIAKTALAIDQGAGATLALITGVVNAQIAKLNLNAADLGAAKILEAAFTAEVNSQIAKNPTVAQVQTAVADVLNAAIAATGG